MLILVTKTTAPLTNNRMPTNTPKKLTPFRILPAEPFINKVKSFEIATMPPTIKITGTQLISTDRFNPVGMGGCKFKSQSKSNVLNILKFSPEMTHNNQNRS
jgi:hypothetical protein